MHKTTTKRQTSENHFLHKTTFTRPCKEVDRKAEVYAALQELSSFPGLLDCGHKLFTTMKVTWTGESWVFELEAED